MELRWWLCYSWLPFIAVLILSLQARLGIVVVIYRLTCRIASVYVFCIISFFVIFFSLAWWFLCATCFRFVSPFFHKSVGAGWKLRAHWIVWSASERIMNYQRKRKAPISARHWAHKWVANFPTEFIPVKTVQAYQMQFPFDARAHIVSVCDGVPIKKCRAYSFDIGTGETSGKTMITIVWCVLHTAFDNENMWLSLSPQTKL